MGVVGLGKLAGCASDQDEERPAPPAPVPSSSSSTTCVSTDAGTATQPAFLVAPTQIPAANVVEAGIYDVVVVGGGIAGCTAACAAAEKGLSVIVLEKTTQVNGRGGGIGAADSKLLKQIREGTTPFGWPADPTMVVDKVGAQKLWIKSCASRVDERLVSLFFNRSAEAINWLIDKVRVGAPDGGYVEIWNGYDRNPTYPDQPAYHFFSGSKDPQAMFTSAYGGQYVTNLLRDSALATGRANFVYNSPAQQLVQENGRVTAVIAKDSDGYKRYAARKGVVLATGDIGGDQAMLDYYCPVANNAVARLYSPVGANTGDGHKMGMWVGGQMQASPLPPMIHPQADAYFHAAFLFLNTKGRRFMNEATWVQGKSLAIMNQPGHYAWAICDANWLTQLKAGLPKGGGMFWDWFRSYPDPFDDSMAQVLMQSDLQSGKALQANDLGALAAAIGVDAATMIAEISRYNALVDGSADLDFYKDPLFLGKISDPPFIAMKVGPALLSVVGGLMTDTSLNVLDANGNGIAGLYAVGNVAGGVFASDYPINIPGCSHGRCLTWGYVVAESLAAV
jgi:fumarate reductase flavoprotein subunit